MTCKGAIVLVYSMVPMACETALTVFVRQLWDPSLDPKHSQAVKSSSQTGVCLFGVTFDPAWFSLNEESWFTLLFSPTILLFSLILSMTVTCKWTMMQMRQWLHLASSMTDMFITEELATLHIYVRQNILYSPNSVWFLAHPVSSSVLFIRALTLFAIKRRDTPQSHRHLAPALFTPSFYLLCLSAQFTHLLIKSPEVGRMSWTDAHIASMAAEVLA